MVRIFGHVVLSLLMVFQAVQPALANGWVVVEDCCICAAESMACEPVVECGSCGPCASAVMADSESTVVGDCGCGEVQPSEEVSPKEEPAEPLPSQPRPAETQRPRTFADEPAPEQPAMESATPSLDTAEETLPPAPIAVPPSESSDTQPSTEQILPGPAAEETPPAEQPRQIDSEGLFDEPAPPTDTPPAPAATSEQPAGEQSTDESTGTEGLFDEPTPPAEESTEDSTESTAEEEPQSEAEETDEAEPATDPLEGLFEPTTPTTEPETEPAPESQPESSEETEESPGLDPFSQLPPVLKSAGGLASREFRTWSNREATARYEARLVRFSTDGVLLTTTKGETVTMTFVQLSDADLAFVRDQVRAQRIVLARSRAGIQSIVAQASSL